MDNQRFYKRERLSSKSDIDRLFPPVATGGRHSGASVEALSAPRPNSVMTYPWRAVWLPNIHEGRVAFPRLLIMVPKRRLRHAVDRVTMRRRLREAWRTNRHILLADGAMGVDIALIYVADHPTDVAASEASLHKLFGRIRSALEQAAVTPPSNES